MGLAEQGWTSNALPGKEASLSCCDFARRNIMFCMLEAVEGELCLPEVLDVM